MPRIRLTESNTVTTTESKYINTGLDCLMIEDGFVWSTDARSAIALKTDSGDIISEIPIRTGKKPKTGLMRQRLASIAVDVGRLKKLVDAIYNTEFGQPFVVDDPYVELIIGDTPSFEMILGIKGADSAAVLMGCVGVKSCNFFPFMKSAADFTDGGGI